ncbi:MAG: SpoIID/LytB domain-containing protein [Bacteroidales bacterium]|nr:SpoIID/LytB domain-containing protein [Bacteroidales bacterium]
MKVNEIKEEPRIDVGVVTSKEIAFCMHKAAFLEVYRSTKTNKLLCEDKILLPEGEYCAKIENGRLSLYYGEQLLLQAGHRYRFVALEEAGQEAFFSLHEVRIGIDFHWDRTQEQCFVGELHLQMDEDSVIAINRLPLEDYLLSVIASEMSAHAGLELLRAHAIISRSWLLAQGLGKHLQPQAKTTEQKNVCGYDTESEHIRWYERDAHLLFDVCADDHCQRYQGLQQATTPQVKEALRSTRGIVLAHEEEICDARFYKCCGGLSEHFESCWSDSPKAYLKSIYDHAPTRAKAQDLRNEAQARAFILSSPPAFCNTRNQEVLQQVLNDYDQETADFYRWNVHYDVDELSAIVRERSGIDFGRIQALIPVQRGASARLVKLKIVGEKRSLIVGKELEIRKFLSRTHLYSSAFVVDECRDPKGNLTGFNLQGAGWGHGVGLCQIGAAMMSEQGYQHKEILQHYYPQAQLLQLY